MSKDLMVGRNIISLMGEINDESAEAVVKHIIQINNNPKEKFIQMIINSCGGMCTSGFAIIDMMEWSEKPVYTTGLGMIASMGLMISMAGAKGKRLITPRTSILAHRFSSGRYGNYSQLIATRKEEDMLHKRIVDHMLRHSKIGDEKELNKTLLKDVDCWLTPEEAVEYGVADKIQKGYNEK